MMSKAEGIIDSLSVALPDARRPPDRPDLLIFKDGSILVATEEEAYQRITRESWAGSITIGVQDAVVVAVVLLLAVGVCIAA